MTPTPNPTAERVCDVIAETIRRVDGRHSMGAGALGEHIEKTLRAHNLLSEGAPSEEQTEAEFERARDVIDRMFGWKHLRRYSRMSEEWMDRLRDGIARAITSGRFIPAAGVAPQAMEGLEYVAMRHYELATVMERQRDELRSVMGQLRAEVDELTRQGHPTGVLLRLLAGVAPQEPTYSPATGHWSSTCPCIRAEQVDPECEWHGRPELRRGGTHHPGTQGPKQNETKSGQDFVSLDREKVKAWLRREFGSVLAHDPHNPERFWGGSARALCEAAKRGELT